MEKRKELLAEDRVKLHKKRHSGKKHSDLRRGILVGILLFLAGGAYVLGQNPRVKLLLSVFVFSESTMKSPEYLLYDVNIMDVFSDYFNGETKIEGKMAFEKLRDLPATVTTELDMTRSMELKEMSSNSNLSILWIEAGEVNFYGKDEVFYIEAPMLGDDFGYAFPTGLNLFPKMPELTSDISRQWIHDNAWNIVKLMTEIKVDKTGEILEDVDHSYSEEFVVTIPKGYGDFIWDLLGMDYPDYDVVVSMYLTPFNRMNRMEIDLKDVLEGARIILDGPNSGTMYFTYELPDDEGMELTMKRNPNHRHWTDCQMVYYTNVNTIYTMESYMTWDKTEDGADLAFKNLLISFDDLNVSDVNKRHEVLGNGYFKGHIATKQNIPVLLQPHQDALDSYEVIEWRTVRNDTDVFVQGILDKLKGKDKKGN